MKMLKIMENNTSTVIFDINIHGQNISASNASSIVAGTDGVYYVNIHYDIQWDNIPLRVVVFDGGDNNHRIAISDNGTPIRIPHECIENGDGYSYLRIGVIGYDGTGAIRIATRRMLEGIRILPPGATDADVPEEPPEPTPGLWEQLAAELTQAVAEADALVQQVQDALDRIAASERAAQQYAQQAQTAASGAESAAGRANNANTEAQTAATAAAQAAETANTAVTAAAQSAALAEAAVGKTSYIGANGNWYEWDAASGAFVDTGVRAQGEKGDTGPAGPAGTPGAHGTPGNDGVSPTVAVTNITGGHSVTITDVDGTRSFDVMDGQDGIPGTPGTPGTPGAPGTDGVSPTVAVTGIAGGHNVTITDVDGAHTFDVMDGQDGAQGAKGDTGPQGPQGTPGTPGAPGADGVSPTVAVTDITGGHRVTITDADGTHTFDVMDGQGGIDPDELAVLEAADNHIYSGVDLTVKFADEIAAAPYNGDPWAWIRARIRAGDYTGIRVADYIPFTCTNGTTLQAQVAGIDTYRGSTYPPIGRHIDFICRELWPVLKPINPVTYNNGLIPVENVAADGTATSFTLTKQMDSVATVKRDGTSLSGWSYDSTTYTLTFSEAPDAGTLVVTGTGSESPWKASDSYLWVNSLAGQIPNSAEVNPAVRHVDYTQDGIYYFLPDALKNVIVEKLARTPYRYSSKSLMTANNDSRVESIGKLWFPTEIEVGGIAVNADDAQSTKSQVQYPLFVGNATNRVRYKSGANYDYWLLLPHAGTSTSWCIYRGEGFFEKYVAYNVNIASPVCFRVA